MAHRRNEGGARCPHCGFVFFSAVQTAQRTDVTPQVVEELAEHLCTRHGAKPTEAAREAREAACRYWLSVMRVARWMPAPNGGLLFARCPSCRSELAFDGLEPKQSQAAVRILREHLARDHRRDPLCSHRDASRAVVQAGARLRR